MPVVVISNKQSNIKSYVYATNGTNIDFILRFKPEDLRSYEGWIEYSELAEGKSFLTFFPKNEEDNATLASNGDTVYVLTGDGQYRLLGIFTAEGVVNTQDIHVGKGKCTGHIVNFTGEHIRKWITDALKK